MEDKDEENEKKSQSQLLPQSRSKIQSQSEVSKGAEQEEVSKDENAEIPPTESLIKPIPSRNSNVVTAPSVVKSKSTSEKSKSNILSPGKVSIKTTGENEQNMEAVSASLPKGSPLASSQVTVARTQASDGGSGRGVLSSTGSRGAVVTSGDSDSGGGGGGGAGVGAGAGAGAVAGSGTGAVGSVRQGDNFLGVGSIPCAAGLLQKRSPFIHDPPYPEERRPRVQPPRTPIDYIINLREDLADFQESHGLPRTRDYSFVSLGLALAQETGRAILSVFQMFTELFPILAIVSLILRFALDKLIEILETTDTLAKIKKSIVFALEMLAIMIPLWILFGTIIIPLTTLIISFLKRVLRIKGGKKKPVRAKSKIKTSCCSFG